MQNRGYFQRQTKRLIVKKKKTRIATTTRNRGFSFLSVSVLFNIVLQGGTTRAL